MADGGEGERPQRPWIGTYILDEHRNPVPEYDTFKWGEWMETADRHVRLSKLGSYTVSTIFLGLDHSFGGREPILFETMVFFSDRRHVARLLRLHAAGKPRKFNPKKPRMSRESFNYQTRYVTWTGAELGHAVALRAVHRVRAHVLSHKGLDAL